MAAIPLREIYDEVVLRFRDPQPSGRQFPPAFIRRIIQHSWDHIHRRVVQLDEDYFIKKATISFVADQQHYQLPSDFLKMRQVRRTGGVDDEYPLWPTTSTNKDLGSATWPLPRNQVVTTSDSSSPETYYIEGRMIGFIPPPAVTQDAAVTIEYVANASELQFAAAPIFDTQNSQADIEEGSIYLGGVFNYSATSAWLDRTDPYMGMWKVYTGIVGGQNISDLAVSVDRLNVLRGDAAIRGSGTTIAEGGDPIRIIGFSWGTGYPSDLAVSYDVDYGVLDMGSDDDDFIVISFYMEASRSLRNNNTNIYLYAMTRAEGTDTLGYDYYTISNNVGFVPRAGWNYCAIKKSIAVATGEPDWQAIRGLGLRFDMRMLSNQQHGVYITLDGISVVTLPESMRPATGAVNLTAEQMQTLGLPHDAGTVPGPGVIQTVPEDSFAEWLVYESVCRLYEAAGKPAGSFDKRRGEIAREVINTLSMRSLQTIPRIGESRRRF